MTALSRVRVELTGFVGGPGVATFYFLDTSTAVASVRAFFEAIKGTQPTKVFSQVVPNGDIIDSVSGTITGAWSAAPVAVVQGGAPTGYPAPAGATVSWDTATILDGHRVRGRTYIVPMASGEYQDDGSLNPATLTIVRDAATQLVISQSSSFVVWHRPRLAKAADGSRPAITARDGGHGLVTSSHVPDRVAILTSRRG